MKCCKCGREVSSEYCDFFSDVLDGSKFCLDAASKVTGHLKKVPGVNIPSVVVSFALDAVSKAIPNEVRKYKCTCGHTWYEFDKREY